MADFSEYVRHELDSKNSMLTVDCVLLAFTIVFLILAIIYQSWTYGALSIICTALFTGIITVDYLEFVKYKNID